MGHDGSHCNIIPPEEVEVLVRMVQTFIERVSIAGVLGEQCLANMRLNFDWYKSG
jgi:hypothetical protein